MLVQIVHSYYHIADSPSAAHIRDLLGPFQRAVCPVLSMQTPGVMTADLFFPVKQT